jgi:hypothetical protein
MKNQNLFFRLYKCKTKGGLILSLGERLEIFFPKRDPTHRQTLASSKSSLNRKISTSILEPAPSFSLQSEREKTRRREEAL